MELRDSHGRKFEYLRLSITDRCNFRCTYCLPSGYLPDPKHQGSSELSSNEIRRVVTAFARMGVWKVRLTGGEPTVRRDLLEIAREVAAVPGIRRVALSTNGSGFGRQAAELRAAGVSAVNISLDSFDEKTFSEIAGVDRLGDVLAAIDAAIETGFEAVKVNCVLMRNWNDGELDRFLELARSRRISVRFIELMRTGDHVELFTKRHLSGAWLQLKLRKSGWRQRERKAGDGPAVTYEHPDSLGSIGIIAPYSDGFCDGCNRLRVTARGALRLCLFGAGEASLRPWLRSDDQVEELEDEIRAQLRLKEPAHRLKEEVYGITRHLAAVGG